MLTQHSPNPTAVNPPDRRSYFRKLRVFLFFLPSTLIALLFLALNFFVAGESVLWNSDQDRYLRFQALSPGDILRGKLLALALAVITLSYLTISITMLLNAFERNIWVNEEKMDRYWIVSILAFLAYLFIFGLTFCSWFSVDMAYLD